MQTKKKGLGVVFTLLVTVAVFAQTEADFEISQNKDGKTLTISKYKGSLKNITIPKELYGLPVTVIDVTGTNPRLFGVGLTSVVIPDSVIVMGDHAFEGTKLTSIIITKANTPISEAVFEQGFVNFYESQNRTPGTYVKNGPIWSKK